MADERPRITKTSAIITVAAAATPELLYQITNAGRNTRTAVLSKVLIYTDVGNVIVNIGVGLAGAFVALIPPLVAINGFDNSWPWWELPRVEFAADLTVQSDVLGCMVQVEVEEIGS